MHVCVSNWLVKQKLEVLLVVITSYKCETTKENQMTVRKQLEVIW